MRARLVALVPVLGLVLAACTSSAEQPPVEPPPFSATPTPTPSVVALEVPPSARATDAVGAAQFARFYLEVLSEAFTSGDTERLAALSHPDCGGCKNFISLVQADEAAGKRYEGGEFLVRAAEATEDAAGAVVDVTYSRAASVTRNRAGAVIERAAAEREGLLQVRTVRAGGSWSMRGVRFPEMPA